ncbi:MAG: TIGR00730 family Rossman fold protein [Chitinophagia bacterium]|jgi:uncharacterized protein (TIGR00730 family)|nr:TIGR00730 family Rossman fold protein [Chitinophagia bacterium]
MQIKALTVFCGSKSGKNSSFLTAASALGHLLAQANIHLVYGGGNKGLMGALANGCLAQGGKVIGIIPKLLLEWEAQHTGLSELIITEDMHDRKKMLYEKGDAGLVLPGGMGTLDELFEMLTWNNLKIHNKKVFILNIDGYYDALIHLLDTMDTNEFMYDNWKDRIIICSSVEMLKPFLS